MFEKCQYAQTTGLFPPYCVDFPCNTQSIAASNRLVWRKNSLPLDTFPIFKQSLGLVSPPGKFLFFRDMSRTASFFRGAQKETKEALGGRSKWAHAPIFAAPWTPFTGAVPLGWHGPSGVQNLFPVRFSKCAWGSELTLRALCRLPLDRGSGFAVRAAYQFCAKKIRRF